MGEKQVTEELGSLLSYMTDILSKEFNSTTLTPEYLLISILDNKKCHAYMILDSFLMSAHMNELQDIYLKFLEKNKNNGCVKYDSKNIQFDDELLKIIDDSEKEKQNLNSELLGSEHVLLSMLNPNNNHINIINVFNNLGINYQIIQSKCSYENKRNDNNKIVKKIQKNNNFFPLKSDINKKAITSKNNYIDQYTININKLIQNGKIDSLIGRKKEIEQIIKILARRKKNNAILVGNSGCGKTQIVYGIAEMIENGNVPEMLKNKELIMLDAISLVSGTHFRGMFEERVNGLFEELKGSTKYILFIDDIQNVLKSSSKEKDTDISSMIGNILTEGDIRVIGTTTFKEYRNSVESNSSICRKLQKIVIEPTTKKETVEILLHNKKYYENYHNVNYSNEVIEKIVDFAERYVTDRSLPDSAIDILDLSGANTCLIDRYPKRISDLKKRLSDIDYEKTIRLNKGDFESVDELDKETNSIKKELSDFNREYESNSDKYKIDITINDVAKAVSDMTNIPVKKLNTNEKAKLANIESILKKSIIGQDEAIENICKIVKRNKVGLGNKNKTQGNVLLLGPSGVGKCVCENTKIKVRNKKTSEIEELTIKEFFDKIKKSY